eukprot:2327533-Pleurochrysis_carterae.AAC.1
MSMLAGLNSGFDQTLAVHALLAAIGRQAHQGAAIGVHWPSSSSRRRHRSPGVRRPAAATASAEISAVGVGHIASTLSKQSQNCMITGLNFWPRETATADR